MIVAKQAAGVNMLWEIKYLTEQCVVNSGKRRQDAALVAMPNRFDLKQLKATVIFILISVITL